MAASEVSCARDLAARLGRLGYDAVGIATSVEEAGELARTLNPELILMDTDLQGPMSGVEAAADLSSSLDLPILFLTAHSASSSVFKAAQAPPDGFLFKPVDNRQIGICIERTLVRHQEERWHRSFKLAIDHAPTGILVVNVAGNERPIIYANKAFEAISGMPAAGIIGNTPCFLAASPDSEPVTRLRAALWGCSSTSETVLGHRADGQPFVSSVAIAPVPNRAGRVGQMLIIHSDITAERAAQDAASANQRLEFVGRLAAGVAHDFNNLLSAIRCATELVREESDPAVIAADLDGIVEATQRGAHLTLKLLSFAKPMEQDPSGQTDATRALAVFHKLGRQMVGLGTVFEVRAAPGPLTVGMDAVSLEQVLLNLVSNARDAMPDGGVITVSVTRVTDGSGSPMARLMVRDTGRGMDAATIQSAFEPFFTTKATRGTGLGLWTSRMLVERAGGRLALDSRIGVGTTFTVDLPLVDAVDGTGDAEVRDRRVRDVGGAICLVVDDEAALRRAYGRALASAGFTVVEASSFSQARAEIHRLGGDLALLITDLDLQGDQGSELIPVARAASPDVPVIVVSGHADITVDTSGTATSALRKPFPIATLIHAAVDALADRVQAADAGWPSRLSAGRRGRSS